MSASKKNFKKTLGKRSLWRKPWPYLAILAAIALLGFAAMQVPAVERRVLNLYSTLYYRLNPPSENVFGPSQQGTLDASVLASLTAMMPTQTPVPEQTPTPEGDLLSRLPRPNRLLPWFHFLPLLPWMAWDWNTRASITADQPTSRWISLTGAGRATRL